MTAASRAPSILLSSARRVAVVVVTAAAGLGAVAGGCRTARHEDAPVQSCDDCANPMCTAQAAACARDPECAKITDCIQANSPCHGEATCNDEGWKRGCAYAHPKGIPNYGPLYACQNQAQCSPQCKAECIDKDNAARCVLSDDDCTEDCDPNWDAGQFTECVIRSLFSLPPDGGCVDAGADAEDAAPEAEADDANGGSSDAGLTGNPYCDLTPAADVSAATATPGLFAHVRFAGKLQVFCDFWDTEPDASTTVPLVGILYNVDAASQMLTYETTKKEYPNQGFIVTDVAGLGQSAFTATHTTVVNGVTVTTTALDVETGTLWFQISSNQPEPELEVVAREILAKL